MLIEVDFSLLADGALFFGYFFWDQELLTLEPFSKTFFVKIGSNANAHFVSPTRAYFAFSETKGHTPEGKFDTNVPIETKEISSTITKRTSISCCVWCLMLIHDSNGWALVLFTELQKHGFFLLFIRVEFHVLG